MVRPKLAIFLARVLLVFGLSALDVTRGWAADAKAPPGESALLDNAPPNVVMAYWEAMQGDFLVQEGDVAAACKHYAQAILFAPDCARAYRGWGLCYLVLGYPEKALAKLDEVIRLDPRDAIAYQNRAVGKGMLKQWDDAVADCDKSIAIDADRAECWCVRADLFASKGDKDRAIADWTHAIELDPQDFLSLYRRGNCFAGLGNLDKAEEDLSKAIEIAPSQAMLYFHRGYWREQRREYAAAIDDYQKTLKLDGSHEWAHGCLALLYAAAPTADLRDGKAAVEHARQACELSQWKTPTHLTRLAAAHAELGDFKQAIRWQTKAIELAHPEFNVAAARLVLELYRTNQPRRLRAKTDGN